MVASQPPLPELPSRGGPARTQDANEIAQNASPKSDLRVDKVVMA
jgi:hypothetical protein